MGEGEAKGEVAGRWWLSRQPVKGRGQSTRLASLGAFQVTELAGSPPLRHGRACRHTARYRGWVPRLGCQQQAWHGRKGGQENLLRAAEQQRHATRTRTTTTTCRISTDARHQFQLAARSHSGAAGRGARWGQSARAGGVEKHRERRERGAQRFGVTYSPTWRLSPRTCHAAARAGPGGLPRVYKPPGKPWGRV